MPRMVGARRAAYGVAVGGVLLAHELAYRLVAPHGAEELLDRTGHAYLRVANHVGISVALVALAWVFLGRLTSPRSTPRLGRIAASTVAFQVAAFVVMEVAERLVEGVPLAELLHERVLAFGVASQVVVGLLVALVIRGLLSAADLAVAAGAPWVPDHPAVLPLAREAGSGLRQVGIARIEARAPPSLAR